MLVFQADLDIKTENTVLGSKNDQCVYMQCTKRLIIWISAESFSERYFWMDHIGPQSSDWRVSSLIRAIIPIVFVHLKKRLKTGLWRKKNPLSGNKNLIWSNLEVGLEKKNILPQHLPRHQYWSGIYFPMAFFSLGNVCHPGRHSWNQQSIGWIISMPRDRQENVNKRVPKLGRINK